MAELETLVACAAEGTMAAAAEMLGISRPAVAKRIRNLEALAGCTLLRRSGRGVALTDTGAALLPSARRMLDERDVVLEGLARIRREDRAPSDGISKLLRKPPARARASQQPEARLAEAERLLELVLSMTSTGLAISDANTAAVHTVNDAMCRFTARTREELLSRTELQRLVWDDASLRDRVIERLLKVGFADDLPIRVRRPDGTIRLGSGAARLLTLGGTRQVIWAVDDEGDERS